MTADDPTTPALLPSAYRECKRVAAAHGRTYFLATRLLAPEQRPAIHALYAFARLVDDIVDRAGHAGVPAVSDGAGVPAVSDGAGVPAVSDGAGVPAVAGPTEEIDLIERALRGALVPCGGRVPPDRPPHPPQPDPPTTGMLVLSAVVDTIQRYDIDARHFWTFLDSMRMDVPGAPTFRNRYATMDELGEYMRGSAAAIGLQLLPVLGTVVPVREAEPGAAALGEAFQLTNFLRDVAEDLDRDRVYLPADILAAFGVSEALLFECRRTGHTDRHVRHALAHLIALNRDIYRRAIPAIDLLAPRVRPGIRTAAALYADILYRIERNDYAVFDRRALVPRRHRLRVAATEFATAALRGELVR
ncbi:phytoene/squalene synthase family protein [Nocardia sp. CNY236]|uniref:phytoene/squalene synthase family protein n=1 Tax=Nocardia sp. CNY236 TaxID=1169152 RepID=UPI00041AA0FD|nr:phytoene/squalene synthase family protein [Nocardia sp. CNY236]